MINTKLYSLQGFIPKILENQVETTMGWSKIYGQVNGATFEYSVSKISAERGDFEARIPYCNISKKESMVKIFQKSKNEEEQSFIEIKQEEKLAEDLNALISVIESVNKIPRIGNSPALINNYCARASSPFSRSKETSNYNGFTLAAFILILALVAMPVYKKVNEKSISIYEGTTDCYNNLGDNLTIGVLLKLFFALQWVISVPAFSFVIEKYIMQNESVPRLLSFLMILINLGQILLSVFVITQNSTFHPNLKFLYIGFSLVWTFKFWSYHHVLYDIRQHAMEANKIENILRLEDPSSISQSLDGSKVSKANLQKMINLPRTFINDILAYPGNITSEDILMYCFIPTLCFQLRYPMGERNIPGFIFGIFK